MPRRNQGPRLHFLEKRGVYYIVWTQSGRSKQRSTGTADRQQAEIALAEFLHQRQRKAGPRAPDEVLITDLLVDYAEAKAATVVAVDRIAYALVPLAEFWEGRTAANVTSETTAAYDRWRGRSAGTVRRELGVLRAAINHAHQEGRLTRTIHVKLPDRPEPKDRWLTKREAARLLNAALREPTVRLYLPLFIVLGLRTGARKEAILSLRWSQVDLESGRIDFNQPGRKRTNKRRSRIPIPRKVLHQLRRARLRGSELGFVINRDGKRIKDIKKGFAAACRRAGLQDVSPHTLRHTCATWLMQNGVSMYEASGFLGMSLETLERTYAHQHPDFLRSASEGT
ncbi:MAG: site-specific integrase [Pseudomonadota bacterium]